MHSETELSFDDCFWNADLIDIDLSRALKIIRLITAPEVVPCLPDPRALTEVRFHKVSEFAIRATGESEGMYDEGPRSWSIESVDRVNSGSGIVVRIFGGGSPFIEIACERVDCALMPLDTLAKMKNVASAFGSLRECE